MSATTRRLAVVCVLLLVAVPATTGGPFGGAAAASAAEQLSIESVAVSPDSPVPGELVTVNATISGGTGDVTIDRVVLETRGGPVDSVENLWQVGDEDATVQLATRFDSGGTHYVWVNVYATTDSGEQLHRERAVAVDVDGVAPNVAVTSESPVADAESTLSLSVTNTLDVAMENLRVELDGVDVRAGDAFVARLGAGESTTLELTVVPEEPGVRTVNATLVFATAEDDRRSVRVPLRLTVEPLEEDVTVSTDTGGRFTATVANGGNRPLTDVTVTATADGRTLDRVLLGEVPAGESRTVPLDLGGAGDGANVTVTVDYEVGTRSGSVTEHVGSVVPPDGRIELTGVSVVEERGKLRISGSASNVGLEPVNGTIVAVVDTDGVTPAEPNRDFFVGSVPASDFVSFDVYATVSGDVDAIPLRVSYLVGGERVDRVVEVPYEGGGPAAAMTPRPQQGGGAGGPLVLVGGVLAVVVVGAGAIVWRRRA